MRIWLVTIGEPLPTDGTDDRLLRTGILAQNLVSCGHQVTWWTSAFDHVRKRQRCDQDQRISISEAYDIQLLHANSYGTNVSVRRIANHRSVAKAFRRLAANDAVPDVILSSWPIVELCLASIRFGQLWNIPVIVDIRDLWPDAIVDLMPRILQPAAKVALFGMRKDAQRTASQASAIIGITNEYVDWALSYAGRQRTGFDNHFPLGYADKSPSAPDIRNAEQFWAQYGISSSNRDFIACWFGMLGRHSEIDTVLEAARAVARSGKPIRFVLCGTGPELPRFKRLAQDCPNVIFPGWVNAAQIWTLLRASSVGLAPYVSNENYVRNIPNKPVEYLSAGLPIVSSLQGVLAKLLATHDCGVTYGNGRADELTRTLIELAGSPRLQTMSSHARALFLSQFRAEQVYSKMHDYLVEVAESFSLHQTMKLAA